MTGTLTKLGPLLAVAGLAGYCLLPVILPEPVPRAPESKEAAIAKELLEPALEAAIERNPFELDSSTTRTTHPTATQAQTEAVDEPRLPEGLLLGATLVHGSRHAAVINGKIYSEGESVPVPAAAAAAASKLVLGRVEHDRVWLAVPWHGEQRSLALEYVPRARARQQAAGVSPAATAAAPTAVVGGSEPGNREQIEAMAGPGLAQARAIMSLAQSLGLLQRGSPGGAGNPLPGQDLGAALGLTVPNDEAGP